MKKHIIYSKIITLFALTYNGLIGSLCVEKSAQAAPPAKDAVNLDLSSQEFMKNGYLILNESDARKVEEHWKTLVNGDADKIRRWTRMLLNIQALLSQTDRRSTQTQTEATKRADAILVEATKNYFDLYKEMLPIEINTLKETLIDMLMFYDAVISGTKALKDLPTQRAWVSFNRQPINQVFYDTWSRRQRNINTETRSGKMRVNLDDGKGWLNIKWLRKYHLIQPPDRNKVEHTLIRRFAPEALLKTLNVQARKIPEHSWSLLQHGLILLDRSEPVRGGRLPVSILLLEPQYRR